MNLACVLHLLGRLCTVLAGLLLLPLLVCLHDGTLTGDVARLFLEIAAGTLVAGIALRLAFRMRLDDFQLPEAFGVVTGAWLVFGLVGALPFLLTGAIPRAIDAAFETVSGATTCGASILPDPAALDRALLLWRATLHLVGGLGIVALSVAILPALGAGGNFLFQAEASGPEKDKLLPRISTMSKLLWSIYIGLTLANILALVLAGMGPFDAICHAFATVATGGFGTRGDSLASFPAAVQWVCIVFMLLAGTNYVLLLAAARGRVTDLVRNTEWRVYMTVMAGVSLLCVVVQMASGGVGEGFEPLVRGTVFSVVSLGSTTGFATVDFDRWPVVLHGLLMFSMFCGACAGSTSGANKMSRMVLYWKLAGRELRRLLRPSAVVLGRVQERAIPEGILLKAIAFLGIFLLLWVAGTAVLMATGLGAEEAFSGVLTCLSGVGPGFGRIGPTHNFAGLTDVAKGVLIVMMLAGRLEFFALLVLASPYSWRR